MIHWDSRPGVIAGLDRDLTVQVVGRDGFGEPDSVLGFEELEAVGLHEAGCDFENDGLAMFSSNFMSTADISAKLDVLAGHFGESLALDRIHEAEAGAMVEKFRWRFRSKLYVDIDRMTLRGTDAVAFFREGKSLLACLNDGFEPFGGEFFSVKFETCEEVVNFGPSLGIE